MTPEPNPFAPPGTRPEARGGLGRGGPIRMALRAVAVFAGFSLIAGPIRPADDLALRGGSPYAKAFGALLLLAAFVPIGEPRGKARAGESKPEEL